jgi:hypothetical protein
MKTRPTPGFKASNVYLTVAASQPDIFFFEGLSYLCLESINFTISSLGALTVVVEPTDP